MKTRQSVQPRNTRDAKQPAPRVVVLAYDGLCTFEFGCAVEIFALPRPELNVPWYRFAVHAVQPGPLRAAGGLRVQLDPAHQRSASLSTADIIVIPGWTSIDTPVPQALEKQLLAAHQLGARICSICSGAFVLAQCGLLDGRTATTHWRYAQALAQYEAITVDANALYIQDGNLTTAAGSAAGLDMMLHVVRQDYGIKVANMVAKRLVVPAHREGGQTQFMSRAIPQVGDDKTHQLMRWLSNHLAQPHTVKSMAARSAMSARTLQRRFTEITGIGPSHWLLQERINAAKQLLEHSPRLHNSQIAQRVGFAQEQSFRLQFKRLVGLSPRQYQKQFVR